MADRVWQPAGASTLAPRPQRGTSSKVKPEQTTQSRDLQGFPRPSDGLEPSTPSLHIERRGGTRGQCREALGTKAAQEQGKGRRRVTARAGWCPAWCSLSVPSRTGAPPAPVGVQSRPVSCDRSTGGRLSVCPRRPTTGDRRRGGSTTPVRVTATAPTPARWPERWCLSEARRRPCRVGKAGRRQSSAPCRRRRGRPNGSSRARTRRGTSGSGR
jgi:hypothetical protein